jgi:uncharacterized protein (DUF305 family)
VRGISTTQIVTIPGRFATFGARIRRNRPIAAAGALLGALLLTLTGCSRGPVANAADTAFAVGMVPHHEMGITLDEIAVAGADDVRVRRIAFEMNTYQGPELDELRQWAGDWGSGMAMTHATSDPGAAPVGMPTDADLARLRASEGPTFDRLFLNLMITHHEGAVTMADDEVGNGSNKAAVAAAVRIARVQRSQLAAMQSLLAALGDS